MAATLKRDLLSAAKNGLTDEVRRLLAAKADLESIDQNGGTPLLLACWKGHAEVVGQLLAAKACVDSKNNVRASMRLPPVHPSPSTYPPFLRTVQRP